MRKRPEQKARNRREVLEGLGWCRTEGYCDKKIMSLWYECLRMMYRCHTISALAKITGFSANSIRTDLYESGAELRTAGGAANRLKHRFVYRNRPSTIRAVANILGRSYNYVHARFLAGEIDTAVPR